MGVWGHSQRVCEKVQDSDVGDMGFGPHMRAEGGRGSVFGGYRDSFSGPQRNFGDETFDFRNMGKGVGATKKLLSSGAISDSRDDVLGNEDDISNGYIKGSTSEVEKNTGENEKSRVLWLDKGKMVEKGVKQVSGESDEGFVGNNVYMEVGACSMPNGKMGSKGLELVVFNEKDPLLGKSGIGDSRDLCSGLEGYFSVVAVNEDVGLNNEELHEVSDASAYVEKKVAEGFINNADPEIEACDIHNDKVKSCVCRGDEKNFCSQFQIGVGSDKALKKGKRFIVSPIKRQSEHGCSYTVEVSSKEVNLEEQDRNNYVVVSGDIGITLGEVFNKKLQLKRGESCLDLGPDMCGNYKSRRLEDGVKLKLLEEPQVQKIALLECSNTLSNRVQDRRVVRRSSRVKKNIKVFEEVENLCNSLELVEVPINMDVEEWKGVDGWPKAATQRP